MTDEPTVFVVDDEQQIRHLLSDLLGSAGLSVVAFSSAQEFLGTVTEDRPGCIIADLRMPVMSGLQLQQALADRGFLLQFILLSGHTDIPSAVHALKHGAADVIEKPFRPQQLLDAVHAAIRRNQELRQRRAEREAAVARLATLSPREREVLELLVAGHPSKVIAARLKISVNTVENHRARIMKKTKTEHVAELVRLVTTASASLES